MRKLLIGIGAFLFSLILLAVAGGFAVKPLVENRVGEMIRSRAARIPALEKLSFSRAEFSPLALTITLHDLRAVCRSPRGLTVAAHRLILDAPIRLAMALSPSLRSLASLGGWIPVCVRVEARNGAVTLADALNGSFESASIEDVRMSDVLFLSMLRGGRPDTLGLMEGVSAGALKLRNLTARVRAGEHAAIASLASAVLAGQRGMRFDEGVLSGFRASLDGGDSASMGAFRVEGFRGPDAATLHALFSIAVMEIESRDAEPDERMEARRARHLERVSALLQQWALASTPPVRGFAVEELAVRLGGARDGLSLGRARLDWLSNTPRQMKIAIRDFVVPTSLAENGGIRLPGLKRIRFNAETSTVDDNGRIRETGALALEGMGLLRYDASYVVPGGSFNFSPMQLMAMDLHSAEFHYTDQGALALMMLNQPDPDAAMRELAAAAEQLLPGPANAPLRVVLPAFLEHPGELSLVRADAEPIAILKIFDGGRMRPVWNPTVKPGAESLREQVRRIAAQAGAAR